MTLEDLLAMSNRELAGTLGAGHPIDAAALDDTQYRGVSLGLPGWLVSLTWLKFMKTFHRDPVTGRLRGWNVRIAQDGLDAPWSPLETAGVPSTFGHYEVVAAQGRRMPKGTDGGLLIDYGAANAWLDPTRLVRDPLVAVNAGDATLLLGWSYIDLGVLVPTPSYFALQLDGALAHVVA